MNQFFKYVAILLLWVFLLIKLHAGGGPENVFLVINEDSLASKAIANEYINLRKIPPANVLYICGIKNLNSIKIDDFRESILKPIFQAIQKRGLDKQIDYIVYSSDFPWKVDCRSDLNGQKLLKTMSPYGSINSMTYLYQAVMLKKPGGYLSFASNLYVRKPFAKQLMDSPWTAEELEQQKKVQDLLLEKAKHDNDKMTALKKKLEKDGKKYKNSMQPEKSPEDREWETATWKQLLKILSCLKGKHPNTPSLLYNLACALAMNNKPDDAMSTLTSAFEAGYLEPARLL